MFAVVDFGLVCLLLGVFAFIIFGWVSVEVSFMLYVLGFSALVWRLFAGVTIGFG